MAQVWFEELEKSKVWLAEMAAVHPGKVERESELSVLHS